MIRAISSSLCLLLLQLCGCVGGFIYTDIKTPFSLNMDNTPHEKDGLHSRAATLKLQEPISGYGISVEVNSNAIGDAAKQANMTRLYYADMKTISVFGGVYLKRELILHGTREDETTPSLLD